MLPRVICLGAVNLEMVYAVPDLPGVLAAWGTGLKPGGVEVISRTQEARLQGLMVQSALTPVRAGGGQAAGAAYALARLGVPVALAGRVGADADGVFLRENLAGVSLDYLVQAGESGRAYILAAPGGGRATLVAPNTNEDLTAADLPWEALAAADFLYLTAFAGEGPLAQLREMMPRLPAKLRLIFAPGEFYAHRGRAALEEILDRTETLLVTEAEWVLLGGEPGRHPDWAPPVVLIKQGLQGARLLTPVRYLDIPGEFQAPPPETLDAGDVFAAAYLAGLLRRLNLPQAVRLAEKAAAYKLSGAEGPRYPNGEILQRMIAQLR